MTITMMTDETGKVLRSASRAAQQPARYATLAESRAATITPASLLQPVMVSPLTHLTTARDELAAYAALVGRETSVDAEAASLLDDLYALAERVRGMVTKAAERVAVAVVEAAAAVELVTRPAPTMYLADYATPVEMDGRVLSRYQANILHFVKHEKGNGVVSAVAGSGKTTTLLMAAKALTCEALFLAFNTRIAKELDARLAGTKMTASTIHSIGNRTLAAAYGKLKVDGNKYRDLTDKAAEKCMRAAGMSGLLGERSQVKAVASTLCKLCSFVRLTLTDASDEGAMLDMAACYNIDVPDGDLPEDRAYRAALLASVVELLAIGERLATSAPHVIDFDDMVYLPTKLRLTPRQVAFVMIDEAQDLNRAQLELSLACVAPGGRTLYVGDSRQAIYRFAGADADSFWSIQGRTDAVLLPLSVCYRCPAAVVALAQQIVPEIEAAPNAPAGKVSEVVEAELPKTLKVGDMVVCRLTAPLVSLCMTLIAARIPARVVGREVGEQLAAAVKKVAKLPGYADQTAEAYHETFAACLATYDGQQRAKLSARRDADAQLEKHDDLMAAITAVFDSFGEATSAAHLCELVAGLFSGDRERGTVTLSTVHRAKGLENARVFILRPKKLPLAWPNQTEAEKVQEQNLRYVAITRAIEELVFVSEN